jgi:hypothetical protein
MSNQLVQRNLVSLAKREPGDVIFFHPKTTNPLAWIILAITGDHYHHGAIVTSKDLVIEADPTRGVHYGKIEEYLDKYELDLFRLKDHSKAAKVVESAESLLGLQYDYANVIWTGLGYVLYSIAGIALFKSIKSPFDDDDAVHSEEFIDLAFQMSGIDLVCGTPRSNMTAQILSKSVLLEKID